MLSHRAYSYAWRKFLFDGNFHIILWNAVRNFITFFLFIRLNVKFNTFFAFIKLYFPKLILTSYNNANKSILLILEFA